jgi:hypothetical protein
MPVKPSKGRAYGRSRQTYFDSQMAEFSAYRLRSKMFDSLFGYCFGLHASLYHCHQLAPIDTLLIIANVTIKTSHVVCEFWRELSTP